MQRFVLLAGLLLVTGPVWAAAGPAGHAHHGESSAGTPGKPAEASRTVRVEASDTAFDLKQIEVRPGETIRFVITNRGETPHEFAIARAAEQEAHRATMREMPDMAHDDSNAVTLPPGETKELLWKFGAATDLEFACNIPGHAEQGMWGPFRTVR